MRLWIVSGAGRIDVAVRGGSLARRHQPEDRPSAHPKVRGDGEAATISDHAVAARDGHRFVLAPATNRVEHRRAGWHIDGGGIDEDAH